MNLVFMGTPLFAVPCLESLIVRGYNILAVVTQPDRPKGRSSKLCESPVKRLAAQNRLLLLQPENINKDDKAISFLEDMRPDIIVTAAFGQILSSHILSIPKYACINVHASLLPKYRGAAPINWAIIKGEDVTGISIIKMTKQMDAGDIIEQIATPIYPDEDAGELENRLANIAVGVLKKAIDDFESNSVKYIPQDEKLATYANKLTKNDGMINWNLKTIDVHALVRGLTPQPCAYSFLYKKDFNEKKRIIIKKTRIDQDCITNKNRPSGEIIDITSKGLLVSTNNASIWITMLQPEGKRLMSASDYVNGHDVRVGDYFG